jgi:hypothetical protein
MANRHAHTKLREEIRRRMLSTGEPYQKAREAIVSRRSARPRAGAVDLVAARYFGLSITFATFETTARPILLLVPSAPTRGGVYPPSPQSPLFGMRPPGVE